MAAVRAQSIASVSDQREEAIPTLRPLLKWAGGKRWLLPRLTQLWNSSKNRRLVECFCGGLSVALGLKPEKALLNDINTHLINFYKHVRKGLEISKDLQRISVYSEDRNLYYTCRERFNELIYSGQSNSSEAAELFYFLNRSGYNGLCRFNSTGGFNVPFGKYKKIYIAPNFVEYQPVLARWEFTSTDFAKMELEPGDFVYADPPYDVDFTQYSKENFRREDQERLAEWLAKHKGPVVLSNQCTPFIEKLYHKHKFKLEYHDAPRRISCNGDRASAPEVLAIRGFG